MAKSKDFWFLSFIVIVVSELLEELVEEAIVTVGTNLLLNGLSVVVSVVASKTIIAIFKGIAKKRGLIKSVLKKTLKEGGAFEVSKFKQFFSWVWANKKSLLGAFGVAVGAITAGLESVEAFDVASLGVIMLWGVNIVPILYYVSSFAFGLLGVSGKGFEKVKTYLERIAGEAVAKEEKAKVCEIEKAQKLLTEEKVRQQKVEEAKKLLQESGTTVE